jgi:23S rRNA (cytosine1962-C5)-methyltransferase
MGKLVIKPRSRLFRGHSWAYKADIERTMGDCIPGEVVDMKDTRGREAGCAIYNPASNIVARRISFRGQSLTPEFFVSRFERALEYRKSLGIDLRLCRLVWSEADGLPGLIVDRYGDHIVFQALTLAFGKREEMIVEAIKQVFDPKSITARNDANVRKIEGLEVGKATLFGTTPPPFDIEWSGMHFQVDVMEGHKTGLYLDQLDNYRAVAAFASGRRVLDTFCNQGGFAQACALAGATETLALDASGSALALADLNAKASGAKITLVEGNAFDWLKSADMRDEKFDLIILDPPSFTRSMANVDDALRGYKELHLRALKMLNRNGLLATFSCSHHIAVGEFADCIQDAAADAKRTLRLRSRLGQRADHPVLLGTPETEYLRGYIFEVCSSW